MQQFTIEGRMPGMNEIIGTARAHFGASAGQKKKFTKLVATAASGLMTVTKRSKLTIFWFEPNGRRDVDNVAAAVKFIADGLVEAGVLPDDSQPWLSSITHVVAVDKVHPRIVVTIEDAEVRIDG